MDLITQIIAQAAPSGGANPLAGMWPILLMFAAMYFLIIAPQRKKQKQHQKMITELTSGADVTRNGSVLDPCAALENYSESKLGGDVGGLWEALATLLR